VNRSARAGLALLLSLAVIAIAAPLVAGEQPILVVSGGRVDMPALRAALRLIPQAGPTARATVPEADAFVLRPPIRHDPLSIDLERRLSPPGRGHWLGTDELGRDILSRILHGTRPSLLVALIATVISLLLGIPIGAAAGYGGRRVDLLLARLIEASLSFPSSPFRAAVGRASAPMRACARCWSWDAPSASRAGGSSPGTCAARCSAFPPPTSRSRPVPRVPLL